MAAVQKRIVHKQFNSPIAMYSNNNIQQVLDRELKQLSNGTIGIDFKNDPATVVTPSLAKSAVLKALEDEEREKTGLKRVAWPPPPQDDDYKVVKQPQFPPSFHHQPQFSSQPQYEPQATHQAFQAAVPAQSEGLIMTTTPISSQQQQYQQALSQQQQPSSNPTGYLGLITPLRKEAPITQKPPPVFASQPAAASFKGGSNMRGDEKWPPVEWKAQAAEENEKRRQLALGPVFRPRRVNKDYTSFFEKNALNATYPAYRMPPGTQHLAEGTNF